jgi:hypothetical protein
MAQEFTAKIMFTNRTLISYRVEASLLLNQYDSFSFGNHRSNLFEKCTMEILYGIMTNKIGLKKNHSNGC